MSNFDFAAGLTNGPLNDGSAKLFANADIKAKYFQGTYTKQDPTLGTVTLIYNVLAAPTFVLAPPSDVQWQNSVKASGVTTKPTVNIFQVHFSNISGSAQIGSSTPVAGQGALDVFSVVSVTDGKLTLTPIAVLIDESSFTAWDKFIVNQLLIPKALEIASGLLKGYQLPTLPTIAGITFSPLAVYIDSSILLLGATISTNPNAIDLSGYTWPTDSYFALLGQNLLNTAIQQESKQYVGKTQTGDSSYGNIAFKASADYSVTLNSISATIKTDDPTSINLSVGADLSAHGGISGIIPTLLCPIGTALNAI